MPKLSKSLPRYCRHKASGQAVVTLSGRDFYLGKYGSQASKMLYDRLLAEYLAAGRRVPPSMLDEGDADVVTLAEIMVAYREHARSYYRKNGKLTREASHIDEVLRLLRSLYDTLPVGEFGPLKLKAVRELMIGKGWSRRHINDQVGRIVRMVKWAVAAEMAPADVLQALQAVPGLRKGRTKAAETAPVEPVPDATVEATLPHLPAIVADMVRFQRFTGCRPAEVCLLRPKDVDRSEDVWRYRVDGHKTEHHGRERIIFIGPKSQAILRPYLLRSDDAYCFDPRESEAKRRAELHAKRKTPLSCGNRPGTNKRPKPRRFAQDHYTPDSYRRAVHRGVRKHNDQPDVDELELWSPNRLRHTAATEVRKRFGLEAAQVTLGHAAADVTQVYAARDHKLGVDVAKAIG